MSAPDSSPNSGINSGAETGTEVGPTAGLTTLSDELQQRTQALRKAQEELRASESRFRSFFENTIAGMAMLDRDGELLDVNAALSRLLDREPAALSGRSLWDITCPEDRERARKAAERSLEAGERGFQMEQRLLTRDGRPRWVLLSLAWVYEEIYGEGKVPASAVAMFQDISREKDSRERQLEEEKRQRKILVREVHHRIKNHLQGIVNLLREQAIRHPQAAPVLETVIHQVNAIATVHGLCRDTTASIDLFEIIDAIRQSQAAGGDGLHLQNRLVAPGPCPLGENDAVPVALILNELIQNARKHGHPCSPVEIVIQAEADGVGVDIVNRPREDSPWPPRFDLQGRRGLGTGLELVLALLPRKGARLRFETGNGRIRCRLSLATPVLDTPRDQ